MLKKQLKFILEGGEVKRYHTVFTIQHETVGHHSFGVACMCLLLTVGMCSHELLRAALLHDLAEHQTGDIPSPAKKQYGIGEQVNELETELLNSVGLRFSLTEGEKRTLKLSDIFQGMAFCLREIQLGNRRLEEIFGRYASYASDMILLGRELEIYDLIMSEYYRELARAYD